MNMKPTHLGFTALRGFDAAARLGSFAAAAAALNVTQSAVSHQIRTLEADLGHVLFRRVGRSVLLTDAGRDFAQTARRVLRTLSAGVERLAPYANPRSVILYTDEAFARGFLLPRLAELSTRHPEVDLWVDTSGREVAFAEDEVDLLVTNRAAAAEASSMVLLQDARIALAAPALIARQGGAPGDARGLVAWPLLHDEGVLGWRQWFAAMGAVPQAGEGVAGTAFSDPALSLAAAAAGHGVALGSQVAAGELIVGGSLVSLGFPGIPQPGYRLEVDPQRILEPAVAATRDWLVAAASFTSASRL